MDLHYAMNDFPKEIELFDSLEEGKVKNNWTEINIRCFNSAMQTLLQVVHFTLLHASSIIFPMHSYFSKSNACTCLRVKFIDKS